jgi:hypothetical protein
MKLKKNLLMAGIACLMATAASQVMAANGVVTMSATVKEQNTNSIAKASDTSKVITLTWTETKIYDLISNAVANASTNGTGILSTNLPSNGYIVFNPNGSDGTVGGTFYATNKSGFYFPLSGTDTNSAYYSFIELDTYLANSDDTNSSVGMVDLGFSDNFNGVETGTYNNSTGNGTQNVTSTALLYVHDNPYSYDDGNNAGGFYSNNNAFELRGIAHTTLTFKDGAVKDWSISLEGTGNAIVNNSQNAVVTSGHFGASQQ